MIESKLQTEIIKFLKKKGCFVVKLQSGPGVPQGSPDIMFVLEGFWGAIEVKSSATSKFQPLQKERLAQLNNWSWAKAVHPLNWDGVKVELDSLLD